MTLRWAYSPEKCEGYEYCGDCDTCPIRDEAKPTVFNYGDYIKLKSKTARQADEIARLKAENEQVKEILNQMRIKLRIMKGNNDNGTRQQNNK